MNVFQNLKRRLLSDRPLAFLLALYAAFCLMTGIYFAVKENMGGAIAGFLFLLFIPAFLLAEALLKLRAPFLFSGLLFLLIFLGLLGKAYDLYVRIPYLDLVQHFLTGVLAAAFGFGWMKRLLHSREDRAHFLPCLLFAFAFAMGIAAMWELFEYSVSAILGADLQEDTVVYSFRSYYLSGTHAHAKLIDGIRRTTISFQDGGSLTFDGYLDLGLIDTIGDMAICLGGTLLFSALAIFSRAFAPKIGEALIPRQVRSGDGD